MFMAHKALLISIYHLWLDGIIDSMDMNLGKFQEMVRDGEAWHAAVHGVTRVRHDLVTEQQHLPIYLPTYLPIYLIYLEIKRKGMEFVSVATLNKQKKKTCEKKKRKEKEKQE